MKRTEEMAEVASCEVGSCAFNVNKKCHALAINVGNASDHRCDTLYRTSQHTHRNEIAGVGACKAASCVHNEDLECRAKAINVGLSLGQVQCLTYSEK